MKILKLNKEDVEAMHRILEMYLEDEKNHHAELVDSWFEDSCDDAGEVNRHIYNELKRLDRLLREGANVINTPGIRIIEYEDRTKDVLVGDASPGDEKGEGSESTTCISMPINEFEEWLYAMLQEIKKIKRTEDGR